MRTGYWSFSQHPVTPLQVAMTKQWNANIQWTAIVWEDSELYSNTLDFLRICEAMQSFYVAADTLVCKVRDLCIAGDSQSVFTTCDGDPPGTSCSPKDGGSISRTGFKLTGIFFSP